MEPLSGPPVTFLSSLLAEMLFRVSEAELLSAHLASMADCSVRMLVACVWVYAFLSDYFHTRWLIVMVQAVSIRF